MIVPFSAGPGVTASDELDRIALRIVQGMADGLQEAGAPFEVLSAADAASAELIIQGRIVRWTAAERSGSWFFKKRRQSISVEGKIMDRTSGEPLLFFVFEKSASGMAQEDLAVVAGRDLASGILTAIGLE